MTFYALRLAPDSHALADAEVIEEFEEGWDFLEQAVSLWRLIGDRRADDIEAIMGRIGLVGNDGDPRLEAMALDELVRLLSGVDEAIVKSGIVDAHWLVPVERLEALARSVPGMDLTTQRSLEAKRHALGEVMIHAVSIRNFLAKARSGGCVVAVG
jgi:hypothetical protein